MSRYQAGESIFYRSLEDDQWHPGVITEVSRHLGRRSYWVQLTNPTERDPDLPVVPGLVWGYSHQIRKTPPRRVEQPGP